MGRNELRNNKILNKRTKKMRVDLKKTQLYTVYRQNYQTFVGLAKAAKAPIESSDY
jgi:hypothetical protein